MLTLARAIPLVIHTVTGVAHAQPVFELLGGGSLFIAENDGGASEHGNDSTVGGIFGVGIGGRGSRVGGQLEGILHRTMTRLDPASRRGRRITYVYNRRDHVWSLLGRIDTLKSSKSFLRALGGFSFIRTRDGGFVIPDRQQPTYLPTETRMAWTFGADLVARPGRFAIIAPQIRLHVVAIGRHEPMFTVGAVVGWNLFP